MREHLASDGLDLFARGVDAHTLDVHAQVQRVGARSGEHAVVLVIGSSYGFLNNAFLAHDKLFVTTDAEILRVDPTTATLEAVITVGTGRYLIEELEVSDTELWFRTSTKPNTSQGRISRLPLDALTS